MGYIAPMRNTWKPEGTIWGKILTVKWIYKIGHKGVECIQPVQAELVTIMNTGFL
jgi:hypothetical protein